MSFTRKFASTLLIVGSFASGSDRAAAAGIATIEQQPETPQITTQPGYGNDDTPEAWLQFEATHWYMRPEERVFAYSEVLARLKPGPGSYEKFITAIGGMTNWELTQLIRIKAGLPVERYPVPEMPERRSMTCMSAGSLLNCTSH